LDGGARECLGGEHHPRVRPSGSQFISVFPRAIAERLLGDHEDGRPKLGREIVGAATTNDQHAVGISATAWRKEIQQVAHASMVDPFRLSWQPAGGDQHRAVSFDLLTWPQAGRGMIFVPAVVTTVYF
jgi:hypothetical protein